MSFKLQDRIQRIKGLPGKYKRLLLAMASHARNDGTNIWLAKTSLADEMGVSRFTVNRNMDGLIITGLVGKAETHQCGNDFCPKGSKHYTERGNHWTQAYNINLEALKNVAVAPKKRRVASHFVLPQSEIVASHFATESRHILHNSGVTFCAAKQGYRNPALLGSSEASALTSGIDLPTNQHCVSNQNQDKNNPVELISEEQPQKQNQDQELNYAASSGYETEWGTWVSADEIVEHMGKCWSAFNSTDPTGAEFNLFVEIMRKCDESGCYPEDSMEYARTHVPPKLFGGLRSVKGFHNAVCGDKVSSTNGLIAQHKEHQRHSKECPICLKKVRGVFCARCGKNWVELDPNNKPTELCAQCSKIPSYRQDSGKRMIMTGNL